MTLRGRKLPRGFWASAGPARRKAPARRRKVARVSKPLAAAITRIVKRNDEKKFAGVDIEVGVAHNAQITAADEYFVLPAITPGPGYNQRVGNRTSPTSLVVNGVVSFNDYGQGLVGAPLRVVVMVLQSKSIKDTALLPDTNITQLLDNGTGGAPWSGTTTNSLYPVNTELFTVLGKRTFKISDITQENAKCMSQRYTMNIKCPKQLMYEGASNYPTNFAPFIVLGWCRDDAVNPTVGQVWIKHTCSARLTYVDA